MNVQTPNCNRNNIYLEYDVGTLEFQIKQKKTLFFFGCFFPLHVLIRDFLFINFPPVLLIFHKKFPSTLLFGIHIMFRTVD